MFKILIFVLALAGLSLGNSCGSAKLTNKKVYVTTERRLSDDTAFVVNFDLQCSAGEQGVAIFAEIGGKVYPVTKSPEGNSYQISWVAAKGTAIKGTQTVRFFDDEGVNTLRKAMRNEEDTSAVKPLFKVDTVHPGNTRDLWITSESLGLLFVGLIYYAVCQLRSEVMN